MSSESLRRKSPCPIRAGASLAAAATLFLAVAAAAEQLPLRFRRLTTEQGFSDSTVEAIVQDRLGFMWFGTADGLNRYDGYSFKVYSHVDGDPTSISGNYVWDLAVDSEGVLWVGTGDGLSRYVVETDSFVNYRHDPDVATTLTNNTVHEIVEDSHGNLWVGTGGGLDRFDRATGLSTRYVHDESNPASLSYNYVETILEDSAGRLWIGTQGGLDLYHRETDSFSNYRHDPADAASLSNNFVRVIHEDRSGDLWIGTGHGLNRMDPANPGRFMRYQHDPADPESLPDDLVWSIHEDSDGNLWVGTDRGGLAKLDRERQTFSSHRHDPTDPTTIGSNVVSILYEDDAGDLWTGNFAGGVNFLDRRSMVFAHFDHDPHEPGSLNHSSVLAIEEDARGDVWVGTEDGLARFDRATGRFRRFRHDAADPDSLSARAVNSILEDRDGRMWVGTWSGGLNLFDRESGRFSRRFPAEGTDPSSGSLHIKAIAEDFAGNLWLGTFDGVHRLDAERREVTSYSGVWQDPLALGHDITWTIFEDSQDRLWFGTHAGLSLYVPERDGFVTYVSGPEDDTSQGPNQIMAIHEDEQGRLWLATHGGGLKRFDPEERTFSVSYRATDGLASDVVYSIVSDAGGDLWVGTNRGLSRFDMLTETFTTFDERDGIQGRQFNNAAMRLSTGELVFGGIHGLNVFDPADIEPNRQIPPVVLTSFQVFNQPVPIGDDGPLEVDITVADRIVLDHDQSVFSFDFASLSYRSPGKNQYAYMLEGFDSEWIYSPDRRTATYTNLNPGSYTFRVKASNNSGVWNEEGASVRLVVKPPYWSTWWFRALSMLAVALVATVSYRVRVRGLTERARVLQREIDERKRVEEAREKLIAELEANRTALERQNAELERFAYTVSHDLKSPLVTIRGFLGVLERDAIEGDRDRVKRDMQQITAATETMSRLLSDILELARVGRVANPVEEVLLGELAQEAVNHLSGAITANGVAVAISPDLPVLRGDRSRLLEVFQNLIENAIKFMGGERAPRIEIGARRDGDEVVCFVRDNGAGIAPSYHDKVFGLFERLSAQTEGTGIGLALVKRIVEVHGGRIWVESEGSASGSTFCFVIPQASDGPSPRTRG